MEYRKHSCIPVNSRIPFSTSLPYIENQLHIFTNFANWQANIWQCVAFCWLKQVSWLALRLLKVALNINQSSQYEVRNTCVLTMLLQVLVKLSPCKDHSSTLWWPLGLNLLSKQDHRCAYWWGEWNRPQSKDTVLFLGSYQGVCWSQQPLLAGMHVALGVHKQQSVIIQWTRFFLEYFTVYLN